MIEKRKHATPGDQPWAPSQAERAKAEAILEQCQGKPVRRITHSRDIYGDKPLSLGIPMRKRKNESNRAKALELLRARPMLTVELEHLLGGYEVARHILDDLRIEGLITRERVMVERSSGMKSIYKWSLA